MILISASNLAAEKANLAAALATAEISWSDWPQEWLGLIYFNSIKRRNIEKSLYFGRRPRRQPQAQRPATGAGRQEQAQPQELRPSSEKLEHDREMFFQAWGCSPLAAPAILFVSVYV